MSIFVKANKSQFMKRYLLLLLAAVVLIATSCEQETLVQGVYSAQTTDGVLYVELIDGQNCVAYFQGEKKENGTYYISNGQIDLNVHVSTTVRGESVSWWFGGELGRGDIVGDSFTIQSQRLLGTKTTYVYVIFHQQ